MKLSFPLKNARFRGQLYDNLLHFDILWSSFSYAKPLKKAGTNPMTALPLLWILGLELQMTDGLFLHTRIRPVLVKYQVIFVLKCSLLKNFHLLLHL